MKFLRYLPFLILLIYTAGAAENLRITGYDTEGFPDIKLKAWLLGNGAVPVTDLQPIDFILQDNGSEIGIKKVNTFPADFSSDVSFIFTFDLALNESSGTDNFGYAKNLLTELNELIDYTKSETALISYDKLSYLNMDFTDDPNKVISMLNVLIPERGSFFDAGFLGEPAGALRISERAQYRKALVVVSDGSGKVNTNAIIEAANQQEASVYFAFIDKKIPASLKEIAEKTDGGWLDQIKRSSSPEVNAKVLYNIIYGTQPMELIYEGRYICNDQHDIQVEYKGSNSVDYLSYELEIEDKPAIIANPPYLGFSSVLPGTTLDIPVSLKAANGDITIEDTYLENDVNFEIVSGEIDDSFLLAEGSSHEMVIRYKPQDSAIVFTTLNIVSNACDGELLFITGGFPNTPPNERTIEMISPACGETVVVGESAKVEWRGLLPKDVIQLEYSVDNGMSWDTLATDVTGLDYDWTVPDRPSDECLIRVIQLWPNNIGRTLSLRHRGAVNCAFFKGVGDTVLTGSDSAEVTIWNSNNGKIIRELEGHSKRITWGDFHPHRPEAVTSSEDGTAIVWDISTGKAKWILDAGPKMVWSAKYSPNGEMIATANNQGNVIIWDASTGNKIKEFSVALTAKFAEFDPNNQFIITCGWDGVARMFGIQTGELYKEFDTRFGEPVSFALLSHVTFNEDGSKIAVTSLASKKTSVWDVATTDTLYCVSHKDTSNNVTINSASFFYDEESDIEYLLTSSVDWTARIWDANTGIPLDTLEEHFNSVQTAEYNFDGSRILTSSWDRTAKIWNLDQRDLQMDSTDCPFSIAYALAEGNIIDFGNVPVSSVVDTLVSEALKNLSKFGYTVETVRISGPHQEDFSITSDDPVPHELAAFGEMPIEIQFTPSGLGRRDANLEFEIPGSTVIVPITGNATDPGLEVVTRLVDFGTEALGDYSDTTIAVVVKNRSQNTINIESIEEIESGGNNFSVVTGNHYTSLNPNEVVTMELRFIPETTGLKNSQVVFSHDGHGSPSKLSLFGEGVLPDYGSAVISIDDIAAPSGSIIEVPVRINDLNMPPGSGDLEGFEFNLTFNKTMLSPMDETISDETGERTRTVRYRFDADNESDGLLGWLKFHSGLGNDTITTLALSGVSTIGNARLNLSANSGSFRLTDYCSDGGVRLYDQDGRLSLEQNEPNPAESQTMINFEIREAGRTVINLTDMSGRLVKTLVNSSYAPGRYSVNLDASELPAGKYIYTLETPNQRLSRTLEIIK
ncbi:MAG: choice-of-anchor D domain-containing protein [Candidatus Kapaibacterium sp.]